MIHSFEPIIDKDCRVLILGTMPGMESLRQSQYYANKRNQFWKLIYNIFGILEPDENYNQKKLFLLKNKIALWDVISSCEREGSLDSEIKKPVSNDFTWLFKEYYNISHVFFNGGGAEKFFGQLVMRKKDRTNKNFFKLPSSSPTNTMDFDEKLKAWNKITDVLSD